MAGVLIRREHRLPGRSTVTSGKEWGKTDGSQGAPRTQAAPDLEGPRRADSGDSMIFGHLVSRTVTEYISLV
jgi:hypothetical protein